MQLFRSQLSVLSNIVLVLAAEEQHRCELLEEQLKESTQNALKQRNGKWSEISEEFFSAFSLTHWSPARGSPCSAAEILRSVFLSSKVSRWHNLLILTLTCFSFVDELIQEVERERTAKIEAERKLKGKLYKKTKTFIEFSQYWVTLACLPGACACYTGSGHIFYLTNLGSWISLHKWVELMLKYTV